MADEVIQAPAVLGVEAAQVAVLHQQLQVFPCFVLYRRSSPFVTVYFASSPIVYPGLSLSHCLS